MILGPRSADDSASPFRPEDAEWLRSLEDGQLLESLWRWDSGQAAPHLILRGGALVDALRKCAEATVREAERGHLGPLSDWIFGALPSEMTPRLCHGLAVYFWRLAGVLEGVDGSRASVAYVRSIRLWEFLSDERTYLRGLAEQILGTSASGAPDSILDGLAIRKVDELCTRLQTHLSAEDMVGRSLLGALRMLCDSPPHSALGGRVREEVGRMMDQLLSPFRDEMEHHAAHATSPSNMIPIYGRLVAAWQWAYRDGDIELFALTKLEPYCWMAYREKQYRVLGDLLKVAWPLVENVCERVERTEDAIAFASLAAEMLTFRAQIEDPPADQTLAERAFRICPTHRNTRLILASILCARAVDSLKRPLLPDRSGARALIARAEELWPESSGLAGAKEALRLVGG